MWRIPPSQALSPENLTECENLILSNDRWKDWDCSAERLRGILRGCVGLRLDEMMDVLVRRVFDLPEYVRWGEKTPKHSYIADRIGRLFPQSQFIHLLRDGRDVTSSMLARGWFGASPRRVSEHWATCVRAAASAKQFGPDRYMELHFESLLDDPAKQVREICYFLRVDFDSRMLSYQNQVDKFVPAGEAVYHNKLNSGLTKSEVGKWSNSLNPWQEAIFWTVGKRQMRTYYSAASIRTKAALLLPAAGVCVNLDRLICKAASKLPRR